MLGIAGNGQVFTGPEIDRIDDGALRAIVLSCNVYARASPENKLRIVRALQVRAAARCLCTLELLHASKQAIWL
jgi:magnesium-transporting ATPase (P-type)